MQHQDPLEPQDGSEFVAQLAQFANIELGVETNNRLAALEAAQLSAGRASLMGLVGKHVTARADVLQLDGTGAPPLTVHLPDDATDVEVIIKDELGNEVTTIDLGSQPAGDVALPWDGTDGEGNPLPEGTYSVEVIASNEESALDAYASLDGLVTSIEFTDDGATLLGMGGALVSPASIESVAEPGDPINPPETNEE